MVRLEDAITEFRMECDGWRKAAQKACRWFRRIEAGAEAFMRKKRVAESCRAAERHAKATAPPTKLSALSILQ